MGFLGPTYEWWGAVSIQPTFFLYQGINDTCLLHEMKTREIRYRLFNLNVVEGSQGTLRHFVG